MQSTPGHAVVFITRKFPPSVGGMETLAAGVWATLSAGAGRTYLIAHGGGNRALIWWLPLAAARLVVSRLCGRADVVLCGDALVYAALFPLLRLLGIPHATMVMGLDITWRFPGYRAVVHSALRRAPRVLAISRATADTAIGAGVPPERVAVVRLGVDAAAVTMEERNEAAAELRRRLRLGGEDVVLACVGRLVPRKGVSWFVDRVLPRLPNVVVLVVAGDGMDGEAIDRAARRQGVDGRVRRLGKVDDASRELVFRGTDLFLQPNIRVTGDMEGFGLVTIEAALRGAPVLASRLEGIEDAVVDGITGWLLPPGDADIWTDRIGDLVSDRAALRVAGARFSSAARERYGLAQMGAALRSALQDAGAYPGRREREW